MMILLFVGIVIGLVICRVVVAVSELGIYGAWEWLREIRFGTTHLLVLMAFVAVFCTLFRLFGPGGPVLAVIVGSVIMYFVADFQQTFR